ncbi:ABC transporter ATP-binding protein [Phaeobacter gallaeciensis]|uniref:ABC transporter ATP-binding protein n=2 Tax=Roseobacteraceae TaxID=2854170 RepID=A0A366X9J7_9RHOB|nr:MULTISPECIES: ABC transporter ATP-binding protein [Roseobacteraceae]MBT3142391.1 ABC transporter ATP-binding protein [Falsiruegeria litorea]MBT8169381.1 ABC transporter ATP-binding protein [Falsiruegeria litorea]RBW60610.1 ABC transporter ATP-binding protein [Phaeobacter gallaeciensis]
MKPIELKSLQYRWAGAPRLILDIDTFELRANEKVMLRGPSGSGKSTLLSAIAGVIDIPKASVFVAGTDVGGLSGRDRDRFRVDHIGLIFQVFNLLPWLSAIENVLLPCRFSTLRREKVAAEPKTTAIRLLNELGLTDPKTLNGPASALSIGQQQRVAAARALIGAPEVVLADEPTSALDEEAKDAFVELLLRECNASGSSLLFVSHDRTLEKHFDRTVELGVLNSGTK